MYIFFTRACPREFVSTREASAMYILYTCKSGARQKERDKTRGRVIGQLIRLMT